MEAEKKNDENREPDSPRLVKQPVELAQALNLQFHDINKLTQALLHSSYVNENPALSSLDHNERLEFLGDAIISFVVCDYLFRQFTADPEGKLTKIKSIVVSKPVLAKRGRALKLGDYLMLGHGEEASGGRSRSSILANAFESIVGAIYLDQGIETAQEFVVGQLKDFIHSSLKIKSHRDYKTILQEYSQKCFKAPPSYRVIREEGPDHAKIYHMEVRLASGITGLGQGSSKKEAEQSAASAAYQEIDEEECP